MEQDERIFLRDFFRAVSDRPLEPSDPYYVPLYERLPGDDPVELLARGIEWTTGASVQLLSGFRGTGKSTELRRLKQRLERGTGYFVVLCDIEDYVNLSTPIDVSDFLMALIGALGEAVSDARLLGDIIGEGYWERLTAFMARTKINVEELGIVSPVGLKAALKSDPTFKQRLQERMAGHLGALVEHVREYVREVARLLTERHGDIAELVLLVDSMEHLRGTSTNADQVHRSVEILFAGHADKLHLPNLHVVYTVPPYLKIRYANLSSLYDPGGLQILPAVSLRSEQGEENRESFDLLARLVGERGDWQRLLGQRADLDELIRHSGGHLRDLLQLLAEVIRRAQALPVTSVTVAAAINQLRNEFLPISNQDARWLQQVASSHAAELEDSSFHDLARFLDTHIVLCYHNGGEWYDVHPLIADAVSEQIARLDKRPSRPEPRS